jgi:uncharacterized protein YndB with AHSA1/START domain
VNDILAELAATTRETGTVPQGRTVVLRRTYRADIADVWDALTTAERINRWFLPISGELKLGGRYQFEGNAGGEILACEPPSMLRVSWVMGDPTAFSEVTVRLRAVDDGTSFELTHVATVPPEFWDRFGPGATGVGWDLAVLGLGLHLRGEMLDDPAAWEQSEEARELMRRSSTLWGEAYRASGAPDDVVNAAVAGTSAFYAPENPQG